METISRTDKVGRGLSPNPIRREGQMIGCLSGLTNHHHQSNVIVTDFWNPVSYMKGSEAKEVRPWERDVCFLRLSI